MKLLLLSFLLFSPFILAAQLPDSAWVGTWEGKLNAGGTQLRIVFHLKKGENGWSANMDSPDQMQYGLEIDPVSITESKNIELALKIAAATYKGTWDETQKQIVGNWIQGGAKLTLNLTKNETFKPREFPQEPKSPFPYKSEDISYKNEKADIKIGGTITLPAEGTDKYPVILLITGSGAQDRNETIMGHKPFFVIADHFSRRGFAVLRVDDRGVGATEGDPQTATTADYVTDVQAGIKYLKSHPNIDPKQIFLMGHSEGGLIATMVAAKQKDLAGIVLLAGPGVPMHELLLRQIADILRQQGLEEEFIKAAANYNNEIYKIVLADTKNKLTLKALTEKAMPIFKKMPQAAKDAIEMKEADVAKSCMMLLMPWFRYFLKIDPKPHLKKIKCPVLALNGGSDVQVAAGPNLEAIGNGLRQNGNNDVTCTEIPGLNHLFQRCKTCKIEEYGQLEETFAPEVLKAMESWLLKHRK